ncbi:MAG: hypothetical protein KGL39_06805 [Patescibacteria group bacterium]|nr:hypothetical protein [Patescibacteria group bacterium]
MMNKPILCLDFDGVLHSYASGWKGADVIPDDPVPGAQGFLRAALGAFDVAILSSRSHQPGGLEAMKAWLQHHFVGPQNDEPHSRGMTLDEFARIRWPLEKPAAMVTIDDRALTFTGNWPSIESLLAFEPWNRRNGQQLGATGEYPQGKAGAHDEGALRFAVGMENGVIQVQFGKPVAWLGLDPGTARNLARLLLKHADRAEA